MRARSAIAGARPGARLTAAGCAAVAILATTTACSAATGTTSVTASGTPTGSFFTARAPSSSASASTRAGGSGSPSPVPVQPIVPATQPASPVPVGAPSTGGGGTAGLQDILLFGLGAAALLAGAGSLIYRRRTLRDR